MATVGRCSRYDRYNHARLCVRYGRGELAVRADRAGEVANVRTIHESRSRFDGPLVQKSVNPARCRHSRRGQAVHCDDCRMMESRSASSSPLKKVCHWLLVSQCERDALKSRADKLPVPPDINSPSVFNRLLCRGAGCLRPNSHSVHATDGTGQPAGDEQRRGCLAFGACDGNRFLSRSELNDWNDLLTIGWI